ncbi:hypothetical protein PILCRDRAFT_551360 [Piloderma croceum F 1598]|uniref:Uncharacterized protein n=1 Tax=Piloderma croceum (strain F 1598) TaxID=765440 RepID=A0A0C3FIM9_PILCF|nr:hypothetical protein PILCRDRAFT_551360 [Piloderma croceum F 1598]
MQRAILKRDVTSTNSLRHFGFEICSVCEQSKRAILGNSLCGLLRFPNLRCSNNRRRQTHNGYGISDLKYTSVASNRSVLY